MPCGVGQSKHQAVGNGSFRSRRGRRGQAALRMDRQGRAETETDPEEGQWVLSYGGEADNIWTRAAMGPQTGEMQTRTYSSWGVPSRLKATRVSP